MKKSTTPIPAVKAIRKKRTGTVVVPSSVKPLKPIRPVVTPSGSARVPFSRYVE